MKDTRKLFDVKLNENVFIVLATSLKSAIECVLLWYSVDEEDENLTVSLTKNIDNIQVKWDDQDLAPLMEVIEREIVVSDRAVIVSSDFDY